MVSPPPPEESSQFRAMRRSPGSGSSPAAPSQPGLPQPVAVAADSPLTVAGAAPVLHRTSLSHRASDASTRRHEPPSRFRCAPGKYREKRLSGHPATELGEDQRLGAIAGVLARLSFGFKKFHIGVDSLADRKGFPTSGAAAALAAWASSVCFSRAAFCACEKFRTAMPSAFPLSSATRSRVLTA